MNQFLFVVEVPPVPEGSAGITVAPEWTNFYNAASTILKPVKACTRHQKNVWLLPAENAWPALMELSSTAVEHNLSYSVLLVEGVTDLSAK